MSDREKRTRAIIANTIYKLLENVSRAVGRKERKSVEKLPQVIKRRKVLAWGEMKVRKKARKSYHKR